MSATEDHFNEIAAQYDYWKQKNYYYYENLVRIYRENIPTNHSVLEIGCGTGDVLARLQPKLGVGLDTSEEMIGLAKEKYHNRPELEFRCEDIMASSTAFNFQSIFLADVLEHVADLENFLIRLGERTLPTSQVLISVANPLWEPLLMLAEKLNMKMPEGPHKRYTISQTEKFFKQAGFQIAKREFSLLIPKKLPGSTWINQRFARVPILRRFGFVILWVLKKA